MTRLAIARRFGVVLSATTLTVLPLRASAETYYVRAGGDDAADGLSDATAWATVSRVNQFGFAPGDDVYFRCGDVWTAQALTIDWSGTEQDPAVVGAYHVVGGQETVGVDGAERPLFDGDWVDIDGINKPLVDLRGEHIIVQDLHAYDSYGIGLRISAGFTHNTIRRCKADRTGRAAISVFGTSHNVVEHCEASRASIHYTLGTIATWGSTISVYDAPDNVVRYCEAHDNVGEGINLVRGSHRSVAEYNYVWANHSVGIYVDSASDCTVRHNLVVGTTDPTYHYVEGWHGMGLAVNNEVTSHGPADRTTFLGNVVIGRHSGIRFMNTQAMSTSELRVLNNTLIDNQRNFNISSPETYSDVTIRNNISYVSAADADHGAIHGGDLGNALQSNLWSSPPPDVLHDAATDRVADPLFPRSTGWRALAGRDAFATIDFSVPAASPAVDSGADLGPDYDDGMTVGTDFHAAPPTVVTVEQASAGAGWDRGAWVYREPSVGGAGVGGEATGGGGAGSGGDADGGGGVPGGAGGSGPAGAPDSTDADGGCSCRVGGAPPSRSSTWMALALLAGGWMRRRAAPAERNRRRCSAQPPPRSVIQGTASDNVHR